MHRESLVLLAKYWEPGQVKTRLANALGARRAAEVHRHLVACSVGRFYSERRQNLLAYAPGEPATGSKLEQAAFQGWSLRPQADGNLGQRMQSLLSEQFSTGIERVVLIGADSPHLPPERIDKAFRLLQKTDVVLGPSEDGGYYLLGASREVPSIFGGIAWGTSYVWHATVSRLEAAGIGFETLNTWYDVDLPTDLNRMIDDLSQSEDKKLIVLRQQLQKVVGN